MDVFQSSIDIDYLGTILRSLGERFSFGQQAHDRNWIAWNHFTMGCLSLTQYISKYREPILKLDNTDNFIKIRGFLCGLSKEYRLKVKTQYPKTPEDTIKSAYIYDDTLDDKPPYGPPCTKNNASQVSSSQNGKRRKKTSPQRRRGSKKPKRAGGLLFNANSL